MRSYFMTAVVTLLGVLVLWAGTDGFRAYTSDGALRYSVASHPVRLPDVTLQDQRGNRFLLSSLEGNNVLFTFFYASCGDVCPALETQFKKVIDGIPESLSKEDVVFLSISFDPDNDDTAVLQHVAEYFQADGDKWRIATVPDKQQLQSLLTACSVVAIPNKQGGYEHNAAIYAMDREQRLTRIFDYNRPDMVVRQVETLLKT